MSKQGRPPEPVVSVNIFSALRMGEMERYQKEKPLATVQQPQNFDRIATLVKCWQHGRKARREVPASTLLAGMVAPTERSFWQMCVREMNRKQVQHFRRYDLRAEMQVRNSLNVATRHESKSWAKSLVASLYREAKC
jgi:hypothetical protein